MALKWLLRGDLLSPWDVLLVGTTLFTWGLGPHCIVYANRVIYGGDLGHMIFPQPLEELEDKASHAGEQPCLCEQVPIKTLDSKAWVSILVGNTLCVLSHVIIRRNEHCSQLHWEETIRSSRLVSPGPCAMCLFPFLVLICGGVVVVVVVLICNKYEYNCTVFLTSVSPSSELLKLRWFGELWNWVAFLEQ